MVKSFLLSLIKYQMDIRLYQLPWRSDYLKANFIKPIVLLHKVVCKYFLESFGMEYSYNISIDLF